MNVESKTTRSADEHLSGVASIPNIGGNAGLAAVGVCSHSPACPTASSTDRDAAQVLVRRPEQGWSLLCNGVVLFSDNGELLPNGVSVSAPRAEMTAAALHRVA